MTDSDLSASPAQAFRSSEQGVFEHYEVQVEELFLELPKPRLRARVLVAGDGPPLVMVHGASASQPVGPRSWPT